MLVIHAFGHATQGRAGPFAGAWGYVARTEDPTTLVAHAEPGYAKGRSMDVRALLRAIEYGIGTCGGRRFEVRCDHPAVLEIYAGALPPEIREGDASDWSEIARLKDEDGHLFSVLPFDRTDPASTLAVDAAMAVDVVRSCATSGQPCDFVRRTPADLAAVSGYFSSVAGIAAVYGDTREARLEALLRECGRRLRDSAPELVTLIDKEISR